MSNLLDYLCVKSFMNLHGMVSWLDGVHGWSLKA
jgi:hypothetical protein